MNTTFNFAHQIIAGLDNQIQDCAVLIAELEAKLAKVRETQKSLENERQGLLTLAKAGESAIEQAATFLRLAKAGDRADMVNAFWNGIDGLRDEKPQLTAWDEAEAEIMATEPNQPIDPTEGVVPETSNTTEAEAINVPATTIDEPIAEAEKPDTATDSADSQVSEKPEWHALNWREFLKYAKGKGINTKGKTKAEIELELLTKQ